MQTLKLKPMKKTSQIKQIFKNYQNSIVFLKAQLAQGQIYCILKQFMVK